MLNAFRHQRKGHLRARVAATPIVACSTPFGINGRVTWLAGLLLFRQEVLNAFRHQRKGHQLPDLTDEEIELCSTPFGINGRVTLSRSL